VIQPGPFGVAVIQAGQSGVAVIQVGPQAEAQAVCLIHDLCQTHAGPSAGLGATYLQPKSRGEGCGLDATGTNQSYRAELTWPRLYPPTATAVRERMRGSMGEG